MRFWGVEYTYPVFLLARKLIAPLDSLKDCNCKKKC